LPNEGTKPQRTSNTNREEEKVAELNVLTEDSDAVIENLRARAETLYEMLVRYGNAKVSAEILQNLIDLLKKDSAEGRYVKEAFCDSVSLTGCVQIYHRLGDC